MIVASDLSKYYSGVPVLNSVDLTLPRGELSALIGPNGSGKSTLLSIMAGLRLCESGEVVIDGKKLRHWNRRDLAHRVSFMRQGGDVGLRITVEELVALGRFPHTRGRQGSGDREIIQDAMESLDIGNLGKRPLHTLSGGQKQRARIAMALAQESDYMFLDEPLNNLDLHHAVDIMEILRRLARVKNRGIVVVMHDINLASLFAHTIIVLEEGEIRASGPPERIMDSELLSSVYSMPLAIRDWQDRKVCMVDLQALRGSRTAAKVPIAIH